MRAEIKKANTYYEDSFGSFGAFDYVLANPPFNVNDVSLNSVEKDKRFNTYDIENVAKVELVSAQASSSSTPRSWVLVIPRENCSSLDAVGLT